jgi:hypothetical protein
MTDWGLREGCGSRDVSTLPLCRKLGMKVLYFCARYDDGVAEVPTSCVVAHYCFSKRRHGDSCLDEPMPNTSYFESSSLIHVGPVDHRGSRNLSSLSAIATRTYNRAQVSSLAEV